MNAPHSTFVVVPAYNEAARIGPVLRELVQFGYRVVAVDDGSTDTTWEAMRSPGVCRLRHPINRGQGAALQTGITFALSRGARYVVTFDADGQHSGADIASLLEPLVNGDCDVALGSRFLGRTANLPWGRRIVLKLGVIFTGLVSGLWLTDTHNGLRAFSAAAAQRLDIRLDRMAHASELLHCIRRCGFRYIEVPVTVRYSAETLAKGQSGANALSIAFRFLSSLVVR